jgi:hypothetical protein
MSRGSSFESFRLGLGNPIPFFLHNRAAPTRPGSRVGPNKPTVFTFKKKQKVESYCTRKLIASSVRVFAGGITTGCAGHAETSAGARSMSTS